MTKHLKIENTPGWVKDDYSKAVLNSDLNALQKYKENKQKSIKINNIESDMVNLKQEISNIKSDMTDIKNLLTMLINLNK